MDYRNIYRKFINDRKSNQDFIGYGEIHHIIPRSHGGKNCDKNLIRLKASDHLFAHALLARIYKSGSMIFALNIMLGKKEIKMYSTSRNIRLHYDFARSKLLNRKLSKETRRKLSECNTGTNHPQFRKEKSETTKDKIAKSQFNRKSVLKFDLDGNFLERFDSLGLAAKSVNKRYENINRCCNSEKGSVYGFKWKFEEQNNE